MKKKLMQFLTVASLALSLGVAANAQNNNNTGAEMKKSGSEVKNAGTSMGRNVRHGRVVRGGKHFGKHIGSAGKHFGRGTKKAVKRVIS
ncbi:MAG: hypothetical protein ABJB97_05655 [Acidobacteriota bacterium]